MSVDNDGCFTSDVNVPGLPGLPVLDAGNQACIDILSKAHVMLGNSQPYTHRYPYDWRSKKPIIIRYVIVLFD